MRWRWSRHVEGHFEIQCPHMVEKWEGFDIDPEDFPWATMPLGAEGWTIEQRDPLTVSPSILLVDCGCHGFIREGVWVPA